MTLEALREKVGDAVFYSILRDWVSQHRYANGTTQQFIALATADSGVSLDRFCDLWLFQPRKPSGRYRLRRPWPSVREVTFELFREHGMTTIFGNPGSTELPMLAEFPDDFRYVLGLQEAVAVGMADGYAQASGGPAHVNLHTAPGVGNGMGAIFNAQANHSPLLVTAGQQVRAHITMQANLTNRDATRVVHPFVKWSFEPPRAQDVPHALARAIHTASLAPKGPAFVSLPMDDWNEEAEDRVRSQSSSAPPSRGWARTRRDRGLAQRLAAASNPVLVAGPDIDAAGGLG